VECLESESLGIGSHNLTCQGWFGVLLCVFIGVAWTGVAGAAEYLSTLV
jgi:hypothetical protein